VQDQVEENDLKVICVKYKMNYSWTFPHIKDIKVAFEIGSRDLLDGNEISKQYKCKVYSFECNPDCIKECLKNNYNPDVTLVEKAVCKKDGKITFKAFDLSKYNNMGASSIYEIDFTSNRPVYDPDYGRKDVQKTVEVDSCRLDTFCSENKIVPDAIFMDVQEAELDVLKSGESVLEKVKYIVLEASNKPTYIGGCSFNDINEYLTLKGFECKSDNMPETQKNNFNWGFCDFLYINKNVL
jgi:FkbM family methyltransferase